jgi:hypothetical protein
MSTLVFTCVVVEVASHGAMISPRSRNSVDYSVNVDNRCVILTLLSLTHTHIPPPARHATPPPNISAVRVMGNGCRAPWRNAFYSRIESHLFSPALPPTALATT